MGKFITFEDRIKEIELDQHYKKPLSFGLGLRRRHQNQTLDVWFPTLNFKENNGTAAILSKEYGQSLNYQNGFSVVAQGSLETLWNLYKEFHHETQLHPNLSLIQHLKNLSLDSNGYHDFDIIVYFMYDAIQDIQSTEEAFFKLQLLSQRKVKPHQLCLDGIFSQLQNLVWTSVGPIKPEDLRHEKLRHLHTPFQISHVDKFPHLLDYHVPSGVRIASGAQVRLGAYLGEGTTVMPSGFVNFNAGTKGNAMIEGRVSAGVFIGKNTDIGGGASIMGTLSGGNHTVISIGEQCLLGANSGTGISLGFGCTIAAGLYIYAGVKISLYNQNNEPVTIEGTVVKEGENVVKAKELSGKDHLLFIQESLTGKVICKPNPKTITLNPDLHHN